MCRVTVQQLQSSKISNIQLLWFDKKKTKKGKCFDKLRKTIFRVFWCLVLISSFIFCNILVAHFWLRYKSNSTKMTVPSNHIPLPSLSLPSITICPIDYIDSHRLSALIDRLYSYINISKKIHIIWNKLYNFRQFPTNENSREYIGQLFYQSSGFYSITTYNVSELNILQNIVDLNRYSIEDVMNMVQTSCDYLFVRCHSEGMFINCSTLFTPVTSQYGLCCTFNDDNTFKWVFRDKFTNKFLQVI